MSELRSILDQMGAADEGLIIGDFEAVIGELLDARRTIQSLLVEWTRSLGARVRDEDPDSGGLCGEAMEKTK